MKIKGSSELPQACFYSLFQTHVFLCLHVHTGRQTDTHTHTRSHPPRWLYNIRRSVDARCESEGNAKEKLGEEHARRSVKGTLKEELEEETRSEAGGAEEKHDKWTNIGQSQE